MFQKMGEGGRGDRRKVHPIIVPLLHPGCSQGQHCPLESVQHLVAQRRHTSAVTHLFSQGKEVHRSSLSPDVWHSGGALPLL